MVDGRYYGCSSNTHGGAAACPNDRRVKRVVIEEQVIGTLRAALLTPERIAQFRRGLESGGAARERARAAADVARQKRLAETERTVANLLAAIKAGILTPTTKQELLAAEAARDTARAEAAAAPAAEQNVRRLLPEGLTLYKRMVQELPAMLDREPDRAREILRRLLGVVPWCGRRAGCSLNSPPARASCWR
jgi:hypothetical protein